jgi:hypothetical protein
VKVMYEKKIENNINNNNRKKERKKEKNTISRTRREREILCFVQVLLENKR